MFAKFHSPILSLAVLSALLIAMPAGEARAHRCTGDCDGSDTVSISELVNGVRIALGEVELETCFAFDPDVNGRVTINELQVAVNNVFSFCGHGEPPTPAPTPTPHPVAVNGGTE